MAPATARDLVQYRQPKENGHLYSLPGGCMTLLECALSHMVTYSHTEARNDAERAGIAGMIVSLKKTIELLLDFGAPRDSLPGELEEFLVKDLRL